MIHSRSPNGLEIRGTSAPRIAGRRLQGIACPFNSPTQVGGFTETVSPSAFDRTLANGGEILGLVDHMPDRLLARSSVAGSLILTVTPDGLAFDLAVPPTTLGSDILAMAEAGLLSGVSVGFRLAAKDGDTWAGSTRTLRNVDLVEISILTGNGPAYSATSVSARFRSASVDPHRVRRAILQVL